MTLGEVTTQDISAAFYNAGAIINANSPPMQNTLAYPLPYSSGPSVGSVLVWGFILFAMLNGGSKR